MIRRVRRQFILITMCLLTAVLLVPLVALNVITEAMSHQQSQSLLEQIAGNEAQMWEDRQRGESFPPDQPPGTTPAGSTGETTGETVTSAVTSTTTETSATAASSTEERKAPEAVQTAPPPQEETPLQTAPNVSRETASPAVTTAVQQTEAPPAVTTAVPDTMPDWDGGRPDCPEPPDWDDPWHHGYWEQPQTESTASVLPMARMVLQVSASGTTDTQFQPDQKPDRQPLRDKRGNEVTIDHFICFADPDGTLTKLDGTEDYTEAQAQTLVDQVRTQEKPDGFLGQLQFCRKDLSNGSTLVVFSDRSAEQLLLKKLLFVSILVFFLMEGVIFFLAMILTKRAMRPMQDSFERQQQFISDAGHELKTPLTIISANVDILHDEIGENKWLGYIQSQTERMRVLITDMMNLTKLDLGSQQKDFRQFSLSSAVSSAALPFESQAFEQEKKLTLEIQENLQYTGNPEQIKQLVGIFIDNAIKYSEEHGEIRVTLQQVRDKKILKFFNTGKGVEESEREKIFERFYRSDSSRARTSAGGYGLGLSIAKTIADAHRIKIQVESEYGSWICFVLTL